jgi:outer membrane protein TolC
MSKPGALLDRLRAGTDGARARLRELPVREISRNALADQVLRQNLGIQSSAESIAIARALVTQDDAVFDPTFFSSLSYTNSYTNPRHDLVGRLRDQDPQTLAEQQAQTTGQSTGLPSQCLGSVTVDGVQTPANAGCQLPPAYSVQQEFASVASNSNQTATGTVGLNWNFIIGGTVNDQPVPGLAGGDAVPAAPSPTTPFAINGTLTASIASTWFKPNAAGDGAPINTYPADLDGSTYNLYGWGNTLFWTSSASLSLALPVPFTKNAGYDGSPDYYTYQLARSGQRHAVWADRSTRNSTLEQALDSYWDLAQSVETLRALFDLRGVLTDRQASQKRLFDAGLATRYDLAQEEAQRASLDAQEETAWNQLLATSSHLGTLVTGDQRVLLLPADAEALLRQPVTIDQAGIYDRALRIHPDIKAAEEDYGASKLTLSYAENQDLPDISLSASYAVGQNDAVFGYVSLPQSLAHLVRPDTSSFFVGIQYTLPIGMNATEAALDRARLQERQSYDTTRLTRQTVVNTVDQALGTARSAELVVRQSRDDLKLAQCAFDRAREQHDLGLVAEFEVLNKYQDLVAARLGLITAEINVRKAQINLLAAQGTLEQDYVR